RFDDELLEAAARFVERWRPDPAPAWVTCIPSHRHPELVPDFARRLAERLGVPFAPALELHGEPAEQSAMQNSAHQFRNVFDALAVDPDQVRTGPVLLVDDLVDSRWTLAVASSLLGSYGCEAVHPFVLAQAGGSS
ncbi:MAG: phosphoribosyltransferase, partial [Planctomycetota bacterium]